MKSVSVRRHVRRVSHALSRTYASRRIETIDGVEVHRPPVGSEVVKDLPDIAELIDKGSLEAYEDRLRLDLEAIGLEEQHVLVARAEDGKVQGILVGFFLGEAAYDVDEDLYGSTLLEVLSSHAYIDAMEVYEKRRGVGRKLFLAFEKWARKQGALGIAGYPIDERARQFDSAMGMIQHPDDYKLWVKWIETEPGVS